MANDNRPEIVLDGDVSPFRQKLREAASDLKKFGDEGSNSFERMTGPLGAMQEKFVAIGALLAGGAVFQAAVEITKEWTEQSVDLGAALGITATEAGNLKAALADEGVELGTFMAAAQKLASNLKNDEEALQSVGLATRDVAGNLRPLNQLTVEAIELTGKYKAGTDRAIAASILFGKGFEIAGDLAKVNSQLLAENTQRQKELSATVSQESVAAFEEYDASSKGVSATLRALQQTVGLALMPVLATLANWFISIGPAAVMVFKGVFGGLAATFHLVTTGVTVLWETLNALVVTFTEPLRAMVSALYHIASGDFVAAAEQLRNIPATIGDAWGDAFDKMTAKAQSTRDRIWNLFADGTPTGAADTGGRSGNALVKKNTDKENKAAPDPSFMAYYDLALAEEKKLASEKSALRDYTKQEELAFWQTLLQHATLTNKDRVAIEKKSSELTVAIRRQEAKEKQDMDSEGIRFSEASALGRVDAEAAAAQAAVDASQMSKMQLAQLEIQFEQQRLEIQRAALQERLVMAEQDPNASPIERQRIQNQILQLDQQHSIKMVQLQSRVAKESGKIWEDLGDRMTGLWDKGVQAMMNGTFRWRSALKAIGSELVGWFAKSVVGEMVKDWLAGQIKQLAIKLGFLDSEKTAQTSSSSQVVATKGSEAMGVAAANAVEAGTGAAASQASIPWVGPVLALAAMAAIFAAVSGMGSKVKSASRGFSIPKGMNPMTQLHEEEMVLPSHLSKGIASLIDQGGGGASSGGQINVNYNIKALDGNDVKRVLIKNKDGLVAALKEAHRMGMR